MSGYFDVDSFLKGLSRPRRQGVEVILERWRAESPPEHYALSLDEPYDPKIHYFFNEAKPKEILDRLIGGISAQNTEDLVLFLLDNYPYSDPPDYREHHLPHFLVSAALKLARHIQSDRIFPQVCETLVHRGHPFRIEEVVSALSWFRTEGELAELFLNCLESDNPTVRDTAAEAFYHLGSGRVGYGVSSTIRQVVREAIVKAILKEEDAEIIESLLVSLDQATRDMPTSRDTQLSKFIALILRHKAEEFGLKPDREGYVAVEELAEAISRQNRWHFVTPLHILRTAAVSVPRRFQVKGGKIRAFYGHSQSFAIEYEEAAPPPTLYHGTPRRFVENIKQRGLLPMSRQYVHLSTEVAQAYRVGLRRDKFPAILEVKAEEAHRAGVKFYDAGEGIFLARGVPSQFIVQMPDGEVERALSAAGEESGESGGNNCPTARC
ncbi:MAG: RNA 2'-phosphotransferase [bacterium]